MLETAEKRTYDLAWESRVWWCERDRNMPTGLTTARTTGGTSVLFSLELE